MSVVLAPIDGSERALGAIPWAAALAGPQGRVILLRVIPPHRGARESRRAAAGIGDDEGVQRAQAAWADAAQAELDEAARLQDELGVTVERGVAVGEPDEEIVAMAGRSGVDLIAMASHGRGAIGRAIFGSVADRVARTADVPVLITRAQDDDGGGAVISRLIVPLDGSEIAERALPVASELARRLAIPIHVVRAIDAAATIPMARGVFGASPPLNAEVTERLWQEAESEAKATIHSALEHLQGEGIEATGAILNGSPFFTISEITQPGDLIILTSHGRGGVRRWLLGSVAEKLVREAPVPVLLVPAAERSGGSRMTE